MKNLNAGGVAVLIDADNVSPTNIDLIKTNAVRWGRIVTMRLYGNFSSPQMTPWQAAVRENGIIAVQQHPCRKGKNATDIAMVIDAMDLLWYSPSHTFVLVTGDGDFARLALRIKESGKQVVGMGHDKNSSPAFANSCDEFIPLSTAPSPHQCQPQSPSSRQQMDLLNMTDPMDPPSPSSRRPLASIPDLFPPDVTLKELMRTAVSNAVHMEGNDDGWANLSSVGTQLKRLDSSFECKRAFGTLFPTLPVCGRLVRLFENLGNEFQVARVDSGYKVKIIEA